jgi:predicted RNA-binding protein with PUA domain
MIHTSNMTRVYLTWCKENKLPCISADELLHAGYSDEVTLTQEQRQWLSRFIEAWDEQQEREDHDDLNAGLGTILSGNEVKF